MDWLPPGHARPPDSGMGHFRVTVQVGDRTGQRFEPIEALVDTGATYTWVPRDVLERLGVQAEEERLFILADGGEAHFRLAWTQIRIGTGAQPTIVIFGNPGTEAILGVFTLEGFGLGVDPVNRRLIPVPGLLKESSAGPA